MSSGSSSCYRRGIAMSEKWFDRAPHDASLSTGKHIEPVATGVT